MYWILNHNFLIREANFGFKRHLICGGPHKNRTCRKQNVWPNLHSVTLFKQKRPNFENEADNNRLFTKRYDQLGDFGFHIVNFPFLSSIIPPSPSCGVYISQLIKYARCCSHYDDFGYCHKLLIHGLLSQGFEVKRLRNSCRKFYGRYQDLRDQ